MFCGKTTAWAALLALIVPVVVVATSVEAQREAPAATAVRPETVGLSNERLKYAMATLDADVKAGLVSGGVLLIGRKGRIAHFETFGELDPQTKTPMRKDGIFRIYSMTKPITSVASMMLVEDGKIALADPVAKYIPEFADVKVGVEAAGGHRNGRSAHAAIRDALAVPAAA